MADFMIQFLLCNIWISGIIGILLLGLPAVPFVPLRAVPMRLSRLPLAERFYAFRQQQSLPAYRMGAVWNMAPGHLCDDPASGKIRLPPAQHQKILPPASESEGSHHISALSGRTENHRKYPCLHHCIFKLPCHRGAFQTMHLPAASSAF